MSDSDATVAIVGLGALGSRMAERLDTGTVRGIDRDVLEPGNLATSPLYTREQVERGLPKAVAAEEQLDIDGCVVDLHGGNADALLGDADIILDGSDTVATRRILNTWAVKQEVPWVHVAALASAGQVMPVIPGETACYRCVFGHVDGTALDTCTTAGLHPAAADRAAEHATAVMERVLAGSQPDGLTRLDATGNEHVVAVQRQSDCPVCVEHRSDALSRRRMRTTRVCGDRTYHVSGPLKGGIETGTVAEKLKRIGKVDVNEHLLRFEDGGGRVTVFRDGRAVVEASSKEEARRRYARVVGV